jgi:hypothetical protein
MNSVEGVYQEVAKIGKECIEIDKIIQTFRHIEKQNTVVNFLNTVKYSKAMQAKNLILSIENEKEKTTSTKPQEVKNTKQKAPTVSSGKIGTVMTDSGTVKI